MKICLDIRVSTKGGTSTFIDSFVAELDRLTPKHDIHYVFNEGATPLNGKHSRAAAVPYRNRVLEFHWSQFTLARILKDQQFDIYHSLKHVGPLFPSTRSIYRVPAVGQFIGNYPMQMFDHVYWNYVAGAVYKKADLLIAVSDYIRTGLIDYLHIPEERVFTVHNGVDSRFRQVDRMDIPEDTWKRLGIDRPYILCVGNLVPVKNQETAIKAYARLQETRDDLPLLVLAGGTRHPHAASLKQLASDLGLAEHVRFVGYQSGDQLLFLYNGALALVHPSLHEGFSFTILEAMSCGLPIIASSTSSIPEAAGDAALYSDPGDIDGFSDAIRNVIDDSDVAKSLSDAAIQRVRQFTWERCVARSIDLYDRLG